MECLFAVGSMVTWAADAPESWRYIYAPGPMKVVALRFDDGAPSDYSQKFGGIPRKPGWIVMVEYDADASPYYDPPLSVLLDTKTIRKEIHQMWLVYA